MKKALILLIIILVFQPVFAEVMIWEVLYDPITTENGGEAVLLYNSGNSSINLSSWVLATKASPSDATLPTNTFISSGGYLLIADNGFSLDKDDSSWPDPYHEEAITLANSNGGVALKNGSEIVDAVGWGDPNLIGQYFYRGTPHIGVPEGKSLRRITSTNNNSADFIEVTPILQTSNPLEVVIEVEANISERPPNIINITILDDDNISKAGVQINPVAGKSRTFKIVLEASDEDNISKVESARVKIGNNEFILEKSFQNTTHANFTGNISMEYYESSGIYGIIGIITKNNEEFTKNITFEYTSIAAFISDTKIDFETIAGESSAVGLNVRNIGNTDILLKVKGTDLVKGSEKISLENVYFSMDDFVTANSVSSGYKEIGLLNIGETKEVSFRITTTKTMKAGQYHGSIKLFGKII